MIEEVVVRVVVYSLELGVVVVENHIEMSIVLKQKRNMNLGFLILFGLYQEMK
jgi:hypothetical protein